MNREMKHILVGKNLLLKVSEIVSANMSAKTKEGNPCIELVLTTGAKWTVYANLFESSKTLKLIPKINDQFELLEDIRACVLKNRMGRESNVSREIKELLTTK